GGCRERGDPAGRPGGDGPAAHRDGPAAAPDGRQSLARPRALLHHRDGVGVRPPLAGRHDEERLHVRLEVHVDPRHGGAVARGAAPRHACRRPRGVLAAELPARVPQSRPRRQSPGAARREERVDPASLRQPRLGMDFLAEGFRRALALLFSGDAEVYGIALLTLRVAIVATVVSCAVGLPLGYLLATRRFWGRRAALTVVNTALAFPTVVVGLLLYGVLSRRGPLGGLGWLYTWQAIVVGDVLLALPIAAALSAAAVQGVDARVRRTAETLGAGRWLTAWTVARE